jgi:protein-tyrosine phosphatase
MAEGYLKKRLKDLGREDIEVTSAGLLSLAGRKPTEQAKLLVQEAGGDISEHLAKKISEADVNEADLIFVMEKKHKQYILGKYPYASKKIYLLKEFKRMPGINLANNADIMDPIGKDMDFYREVFFIIKEAAERILNHILKKGSENESSSRR